MPRLLEECLVLHQSGDGFPQNGAFGFKQNRKRAHRHRKGTDMSTPVCPLIGDKNPIRSSGTCLLRCLRPIFGTTSQHASGRIRSLSIAGSLLSLLLHFPIMGSHAVPAISIDPFDRKPNRHTDHGDEVWEHKQDGIVLWSQHHAQVFEHESCAAK